MNMDSSKRLIGVVNPLGEASCFATPIFEENDQLHVQIINKEGNIRGFNKICIREDFIHRMSLKINSNISEPALFAFYLSPSEILIGTKKEVAQGLRNLYGSFSGNPFLQWEIAEFIGDEQLITETIADVSSLIAKENPGMQLHLEDEIFSVEPMKHGKATEAVLLDTRYKLEKQLGDQRYSDSAFQGLFELYPVNWKRYLARVAATIRDDPRLSVILDHLVKAIGKQAFIEGFCDVLQESRFQAQVVDDLIGALGKTTRDDIQRKHLIGLLVDRLENMGYKADVLDIKVGDGFTQLAILSGAPGIIVTEDETFFQVSYEISSTRSTRFKDNIEELKADILKAQKSYSEATEVACDYLSRK